MVGIFDDVSSSSGIFQTTDSGISPNLKKSRIYIGLEAGGVGANGALPAWRCGSVVFVLVIVQAGTAKRMTLLTI
jgi:hypothetical protein